MGTTLITGINGRLSGLVAATLARQAGAHVIGVDRAAPAQAIEDVEYRQAELRGRALGEIMRTGGVDVVVHLAQLGEEQDQPSREAAVREHVLATQELLGACAASGVRRVVLRSSTLVYGARHDQPLFLDESTLPHATATRDLIHDYVEIERFVEGFAAKHAEIAIAVLRCAGLVGASASSPLSRYLRQRAPATLLGFDPLIQTLHPNDAALAFVLAAMAPQAAGAFNLAADAPLTLSHAIRLAGSQPLPVAGPLMGAFRMIGRPVLGALPFGVEFLRYPCIADTRRARRDLAWEPQHAAEDALRELAPRPEAAAA